jgi:PASTA domain/F5/8 type C domain
MRRPTIVLFGIVIALTATAVATAAPPANDEFAAAQTLTGESGTAAGTNVDATAETGEPAHWPTGGGRSAWFSWTAPSDGPVTFETCTADFDTVLAVYTGGSVAALTRVAASDDACDFGSRVGFSASAGSQYRIAVDGYRTAVGTFSLAWRRAPAPPVIAEWPSISGSRIDGATLTVSPGRWSGAEPIALSYRWRRCYAGCVEIVGATGHAYRLTSSDVGFTLVADVTATNAGGATTESASAGPIAAAAPNTGDPPLIEGTPRAGRALMVAGGTWAGTAPVTVAYQWQSCPTGRERLVNAALRRPVRASRSFGANPPALGVDGDFTSWWGSGDFGRQWIEVDLGAPTPIAALRLLTSQTPAGITAHRVWGRSESGFEHLLAEFDGTTVDGEMLRHDLPTEPDAQFVRVETILSPSWVSWREVEVLTRCRDIPGSTGELYFPRVRDIGATIRVVVRASNAAGTVAVASLETARVRGCIVPRVTGATLRAAGATLRRHGCRLGRVTHTASARPEGRVVRQAPRAGARLTFGARVSVAVSKG